MRFSGDGRYFLARHGSKVSVWDLDSNERFAGDSHGQEDETQKLPPFIVVDTPRHGIGQFSDDSQRAALSLPKGVAIYDLATGDLKTHVSLTYNPKHIELSDDGNVLAVCEDKAMEIQFWSIEDQPKLLKTVELPEDVQSVRTFCWSSERDILVAGLYDGRILLWQHGLEQSPQRFSLHKHTVARIKLHPTQPRIFTQGWDETVRVFDFVTEQQLCRLERYALLDSDFSPEGTQIGLSSVETMQFGIWELAEPCLQHFKLDLTNLEASEVHRFAETHPTFPKLLVAAHRRHFELYDIGRRRRLMRNAEYKDILRTTFSSDGQFLYVFDRAKSVKIPLIIEKNRVDALRTRLGEAETILTPLLNANGCQLSKDEKSVLVVCRENTDNSYAELFWLNDTEDRVRYNHARMSSAALSSDSRWVATATWRGRGIKVWDAKSGELVTTLLPDTSGTFASFSEDANILFVAQLDQMYAWEVGTWAPIALSAQRMHGIMGEVEFGPNQLLATDRTRYTPQLVDMRTGNALMFMESPVEDTQRSYNIHNDGSQLTIGGTEYTHLWDLRAIREQLLTMGLGW
ncbi:MAG: WD40 repeat domain-containing protein [Pirellulaceae bacterium]